MIKRGEWILSRQGVAFAEDGTLMDGQHRLLAIIDAGMPAELMVFNNVPKKAFMVLDAGIKRTVPDLTGLDKKCGEVCRLAAYITLPHNTGSLSSQYILKIANSGVAELHSLLVEKCPTNLRYYSSAPMRLAAIVLAMSGKQRSYVFDVYANLIYQNFDDLPNIAKSLIKQVTQLTCDASDTNDTLGRALKVLSPEYRHLSYLKLTDSEKTSLIEFTRKTITTALSASESTTL